MDARREINEFLTSRRARITPDQAGLASYGSRRVPGLRREEVAVLEGVSAPYRTRIERGEMRGVSDSVLDALAGGLRLDDAERAWPVSMNSSKRRTQHLRTMRCTTRSPDCPTGRCSWIV